MDLERIKSSLDKPKNDDFEPTFRSLPHRFFEPFIMRGIKLQLLRPGRLICSLTVSPRLVVCTIFGSHLYVYEFLCFIYLFGAKSYCDAKLNLCKTQLVLRICILLWKMLNYFKTELLISIYCQE